MKRKHAPLAILAIGLIVTLIMLQCSVEPFVALGQIEVSANKSSLDKECIMWRDICMGKINKPQGAKDYVPTENDKLLPKPTPSLGRDQFIFNQDEDVDLLMDRGGLAAGYQCFNGGCVQASTDSITQLVPNAAEYMVMHQWPSNGENAIIASYDPDDGYAIFGIYISVLGGYQDWAYFDPSDTFVLCIEPNYETGYTWYNQITFYIYDVTTSTLWSEPYSLGTQQYIGSVDFALEQDDDYAPNNLPCAFTGFFALDEDYDFVYLPSTFTWLEWENWAIQNTHSESYEDGGYSANLFQAKDDPSTCHYLSVSAQDSSSNELNPDVYIDSQYAGSAPLQVQVTQGYHDVQVDGFVGAWQFYHWDDDWITDNPRIVPVTTDVAITAIYVISK